MERRMGFILGGICTVAAAGAISAGVVLAGGGSSDSPATTNGQVAASSSQPSDVISQLASSLGVSSNRLQAALTQTSPSGDGFIDRLAQKLGIDPQVLRDAIKSTGTDIINDAETDGSITKDMADRLRSLLEDGQLFDLDRLGDIARGFIERHFGGDGYFGMRSETFTAVAGFLGMSEDDLRNALEGGKTLAAIGDEHGKSRTDMEQFLEDRANQNIDKDLANGDITQKEADERKAQVTEIVDKVLDATFDKRPEGIFGHGPKMPGIFGLFPGVPGAFGSALGDVADFLGITTDQLKDELNSGKTPAEIAEAHGRTRDEFQAFLQGKASDAIQELQDSGKITQEQADDFREHANDAIEHFMDASIGIHEWRGGPGGPSDPDQPRTSPSDQPSEGGGQTY